MARRWGVLASCALLLSGVPAATRQQPAGGPVARFHHVHYAVADPAAGMAEAARATEGVRTIVQGIGVGVRTGREFLLFDRLTGDDTHRADSTAMAYAAAVKGLERAGFVVEPAAASASR